MTASTTGASDVENLQQDIAALKLDVSNLLEHLKLGASNGAQNAAGQIDDRARRLYRGVAAEGERSVKALSAQIEEQPLVALLIALGIGYFGGRLLSR
jgi:ElaB/YqjD/DUF883 family membrane-anchored ribosome-binding protein